jgi:hypothetical protein
VKEEEEADKYRRINHSSIKALLGCYRGTIARDDVEHFVDRKLLLITT